MSNQTYTEKLYLEKIPFLKEKLGIENIFELPRLSKVIVNIGLRDNRFDDNKLAEVKSNLALITGAIPIEIKAKKSIASFKLRIGQVNALKVTLRGKKMYAFLDKLFNVALPRLRDFRGLRKSCLDKNGILHIGLEDYTVFPEISPEKNKTFSGLSVDLVTNVQDSKVTRIFFQALGIIFETEEVRKMREESNRKAKMEAKIREEKAKEYKKLAAEETVSPAEAEETKE
ncbi:MAG: 50S ribosomal protein L5 [Patescibacteria group bacterium]|nr:50S ribosomal protein L5 [Patescibacteria group bacterium]